MIKRIFPAVTLMAAMALAAANPARAEEQSQPQVSGTFNDYVWVETGSGAGAWHVTGTWTARGKHNGRGEFIGSLHGVRSDLWVQQTGADPANPALRTPHTHHIGLLDAVATVIPNGIRLEGLAKITANGSEAPYSNSLVRVEITGGGLLRFSNIKLTFFGAAVDHFGPQAYDGLVPVP